MQAVTNFAPARSDLERLQRAMSEAPQVDFVTRHYFADGAYCRELEIPEGCLLVGKVHRREHLCMLIKGDMTIVDETGRRRIAAPAIFVSAPGIKRAGYAHADSVFVNIHRTDSTDLAQIEHEVIEDDPQALYDAANKLRQSQGELPCLG